MSTAFPKWEPSTTYAKVAEANREFYRQTATLYDATELCVSNQTFQAQLEAELDQILAQLPPGICALDACGGSGNISLKLLKRGVDVTLADISPELQNIFRAKCAALGLTPKCICTEIGAYLAQEGPKFHLITFSSALHHLEDIDGVLKLAFARLLPGGLLFTVFDPTLQSRHRALTHALGRLEYYTFKVLCQTSDLPAALSRRMRRILSRSSASQKSQAALNSANVGMLAEYHVDKGIDDLALVERLRQVGYEVVFHQRYADARFAWTRRMIARLGDVTEFKLLLRRPMNQPVGTSA